MIVLGIDLGSHRIGLALSDETRVLAYPFRTIHVIKKTVDTIVAEIATIISEKEINVVILGWPKNMNGTHGTASLKSKQFSESLQLKTDAKIILWDERLTTVLASRSLHEAGKNSLKQRSIIDQVTATIILQNWLDAQLLNPSII